MSALLLGDVFNIVKCIYTFMKSYAIYGSSVQLSYTWLLTSMTILIPMNDETGKPRDYRPIALQNTMHKVYTAVIAECKMDHYEKNSAITEEQAAGKRGSWGCTDQLLINKMINEEVITGRKSLVSVWLDYQKAFDSVPHSWIVESLQLAKIPNLIVDAVVQLMRKWTTCAHLHGETENTNLLHSLQKRTITRG